MLHKLTISSFFKRITCLAMVTTAFVASAANAQDRQPIRVCATLSDLGAIARDIGGDRVAVTTFTAGPEDAHFIEAKPTFIKALSQADIYIQSGMEMEVGYSSVLMQNARNALVLMGGSGYVDASTVIEPKGVMSGPVDRSMGDVHAGGNPHYLLDPMNGLRVAALIRDRFTEVRPDSRDYFSSRYDDFRRRLGVAMVGKTLSDRYEFEKLVLLAERGKLAEFLKGQGDDAALGGWVGQLLPYAGAKVADEHALWLYFTDRFGLTVIGHMEPVPGVPPTTKQLGKLIAQMRSDRVGVVLHVPYYDVKHARFVAEKTGAKVVTLAHQTGAVPGADDYISMFDVNVRTLADALGAAK